MPIQLTNSTPESESHLYNFTISISWRIHAHVELYYLVINPAPQPPNNFDDNAEKVTTIKHIQKEYK